MKLHPMWVNPMGGGVPCPSPRQQKGAICAPIFLFSPLYIAACCLALPDCLLTHYQNSCFPHQAG